MESLKLATEKRNALFFGKYRYRAKCSVPGAVYTYFTKNMNEFRNKMAKKHAQPPSAVEVMMDNWRTRIDQIDYIQIENYFNWRDHANRDSYMSRIQGNSISFFSDDLELLKTLEILDKDLKISICELIGNDIMYFKKEPKFKYRTYFRGRRVPENFKEEVRSFIERYDNTAKICPALKRLVQVTNRKYWYNYLHSSYYVDYNDPSTLTLLHMFFGSMLHKSYTLEKAPEN